MQFFVGMYLRMLVNQELSGLRTTKVKEEVDHRRHSKTDWRRIYKWQALLWRRMKWEALPVIVSVGDMSVLNFPRGIGETKSQVQVMYLYVKEKRTYLSLRDTVDISMDGSCSTKSRLSNVLCMLQHQKCSRAKATTGRWTCGPLASLPMSGVYHTCRAEPVHSC